MFDQFIMQNSQYGYYGAGLLSNNDIFPEHQRSVVGTKKRKKEKLGRPAKYKKTKKRHDIDDGDLESGEIVWEHSSLKGSMGDRRRRQSKSGSPQLTRKQRKKNALAKTPEAIAARRRKLWQLMAKKELGKVQRSKATNHKEMLSSCKRVATLCMKTFRQKAMQSQKNMKETLWRAKRLTREMQGYWKRYDRVERETKRRMEKEAEEQRKVIVVIRRLNAAGD